MDSGGPETHRSPGLKAGHLWILQTRPGPILAKPKKGRKAKPSPSTSVAFRKSSRTHSMGFKSAGGLIFLSSLYLFFSSPSETMRPGAVKDPETDQRGSTTWRPAMRNWEKFHFAIPWNWHFIVYLYYYYFSSFLLLSFYCYFFILLLSA